MNSNNQTGYRKSTYTSTTFIIIIGVMLLFGIVIYLYNLYKSFSNIPNATLASSICPDYWDSIGNGKCKNTNAIGKCSKTDGANIVDFSGDIFTNTNTGEYSKCKWANACNVSWSIIDRLC